MEPRTHYCDLTAAAVARYKYGHTEVDQMKSSLDNQKGAAGWALLWLIGIPIPILLALFVLRGCT